MGICSDRQMTFRAPRPPPRKRRGARKAETLGARATPKLEVMTRKLGSATLRLQHSLYHLPSSFQ